MSKWFAFMRDNAWTWGGAIIVLVTLSGWTRTVGLWITLGSFVVNLLGTVLGDD